MIRAFDKEKLGRILQDAGYDVLVTDVVYGRKEAEGVWEVFVDGGGTLRFVATSTSSPPRGRRVTREERRYSVLQEERRITNIVCQLATEEELGEVMEEIEELAHCTVRSSMVSGQSSTCGEVPHDPG